MSHPYAATSILPSSVASVVPGACQTAGLDV